MFAVLGCLKNVYIILVLFLVVKLHDFGLKFTLVKIKKANMFECSDASGRINIIAEVFITKLLKLRCKSLYGKTNELQHRDCPAWSMQEYTAECLVGGESRDQG